MMRLSCLLTCCLLGALLLVLPAAGYPSGNNVYRDNGYDPEEILGLLNRLNQIIQMERKLETYKEDISSEKRDFDMGMGRGYTGAVQAKHLVGVTASRFAGGPGRRRRAAN